jgi:murein DD-endopeptidase MepM/ murein hydrolase activator NlpD
MAIEDGDVVLLQEDEDLGDTLTIAHPSIHAMAVYAHIRARRKQGDEVRRGDALGVVMMPRKYSWLAHVHFELRRQQMTPVDPLVLEYGCAGESPGNAIEAATDVPLWPVKCRCSERGLRESHGVASSPHTARPQ